MEKIHRTTSAEETATIAGEIAATLRGGDIVALVGDLGAGKTTFTQALARAFGVTRHVRSPTFVRIIPYRLPKPINGIATFVHIDAYRVTRPAELLELGLDEYVSSVTTPNPSFKRRGVAHSDVLVVIEWADRVRDILPPQTQWVHFERGDEEHERILTFSKKPGSIKSQ